MHKRKILASLTGAALAVTALAGCSSGSGTDNAAADKEITVAYWMSGSSSAKALETILTKAKESFEADNEGYTVNLSPVKVGEGDYATKLALMNRSDATAPDVIYQDTYRVSSDAAAGYLAPIDGYLSSWDDWTQYPKAVHKGVTGADGKIYGIPIDTDTRGLWYNKEVLQKAGVEIPWEPETWDDVLDAARKIKSTQTDVTPMNVYAGKVKAEASTMQGFDMLLYGTGDGLYNFDSQKWVLGTQGFKDALEFESTLFKEQLGPTPQQLGNPSWDQTVNTELFPTGKIGISLDGSWVSGVWSENGNRPWKEWKDVIGWTAMPTKNGQEPGLTSMSGGWALAMGAKAKNQEMVFKYMTYAMSKEHSLEYSIANASVPVRDDVASDPSFTASNPSLPFWASLVANTTFRPITPDYEKVSAEIQAATEKMLTGTSTPEEAAKSYDEAVTKIVGDDKVESK